MSRSRCASTGASAHPFNRYPLDKGLNGPWMFSRFGS